ncbi:reverse transcriptase domain-containing protein [Tanacetum coccineum]
MEMLTDNRSGGNGKNRNKNGVEIRLQDAIRMGNGLMDQKVHVYAARNAEKKRMFDNNPRGNRIQQPPFKRQNVAQAIIVGNNEKRGYAGSALYCNKCDCTWKGIAPVKYVPAVRRWAHMAKDSYNGMLLLPSTKSPHGEPVGAYALGGGDGNPYSNVITVARTGLTQGFHKTKFLHPVGRSGFTLSRRRMDRSRNRVFAQRSIGGLIITNFKVREDGSSKGWRFFRIVYGHYEFQANAFGLTNCTREGVHIDLSKIEPIKDWASPMTPTEIRQFLFEELINEFDRLRMRCDANEEEEHVVVRFLGVLRPEITDVVSLQPYLTYTDVCRLAFKVEKQQKNKGKTSTSRWTPASKTTPTLASKVVVPKSNPSFNTPTTGNSSKAPRCYKCQCLGHYSRECLNQKTVSFIEEESEVIYDTDGNDVYESPEFELLHLDQGESLVIQRVLSVATSKSIDDNSWRRNNIFRTKCTSKGKVCNMIIDGGSCENVVSTYMVEKLKLKTVDHPEPYQLTWLKKWNIVKVSKRRLVHFSIGKKYRDEVWCKVIPMDGCHILLGRPWQFDRKTKHDGFLTTHSFRKDRMSVTLAPLDSRQTPEVDSTLVLNRVDLENVAKISPLVFVLVVEEANKVASAIPRRNLWDVQADNNCSPMWRTLLGMRDKFREHFWVEIGNGLSTSVWYDNWHINGPLSKFITKRDAYDSRMSNEKMCQMVRTRMVDRCFSVKQRWKDSNADGMRTNWNDGLWSAECITMHVLSYGWQYNKLVCGAAVYYLWNERNSRLFGGIKKTEDALCHEIEETIRLNLMSVKVKESAAVRHVEDQWKIKLRRYRIRNV